MSKIGFPPVVGEKPRVLVLGSMPSEASLRKTQYYAYSRNMFWEIMATLFGFDFDMSYCHRIAALKSNQIALWDVIKSCQRAGSLDVRIQSESILVNDFDEFYRKYTSIEAIFFNGVKAEKEYQRRVLPFLADDGASLRRHVLPSTSPANAGMSKTEKLTRWSVIQATLLDQG